MRLLVNTETIFLFSSKSAHYKGRCRYLFKNITEYSLCTKIISRNIQPDVNNEYLNTRMEKKELIENLRGKINISICYNSYTACYKNYTNIIELRFTLICQREQKAM